MVADMFKRLQGSVPITAGTDVCWQWRIACATRWDLMSPSMHCVLHCQARLYCRSARLDAN